MLFACNYNKLAHQSCVAHASRWGILAGLKRTLQNLVEAHVHDPPVLFQEAIYGLLRIARVLRMRSGHVAAIGAPGSGLCAREAVGASASPSLRRDPRRHSFTRSRTTHNAHRCGSGRTTLARCACALVGSMCFVLGEHKGAHWKHTLKKAAVLAGRDQKQVGDVASTARPFGLKNESEPLDPCCFLASPQHPPRAVPICCCLRLLWH